MVLVNFSKIDKTLSVATDNKKQPEALNTSGASLYFSAENELLTKNLGQLVKNQDKHFWSFGNFNMMRLIFWVLDKTGPAEILMSTTKQFKEMLI
ncbi:MAG: hypothetical protein LBN95_07935 [Prevotellaceae bacterium]|jgi:hypothetical protein|nr:hypothetical protein [Prevotellaceae bacterium]